MTVPAESRRRSNKSSGTGITNSREVSEVGAGKWSMGFRKSNKIP